MRHSMIALALLGVATPAAAQPHSDSDDILAETLPPQEEIDRTANRLHRVLDVLMDVQVGPIVEAIDPDAARDPYRRGQTLGEMAARDDPYYRERMHDSVGAVTAGMSDLLMRLARVAPVIERSVEDMQNDIDEALDEPSYDPLD